MLAAATDGSFLRHAGIPTYGSGLPGDVTDVRAHGKDERVPMKSFRDGHEYLYRLVKALASDVRRRCGARAAPGPPQETCMAEHREPPPNRLPIKLDSTSNGEFEPVPLGSAPRLARALAREAIADAARRVGASRRRYLQSLLGAAATLGAFNRAFAAAGQRGGHYVLPAESPFETAAAQVALGGDEFIFDVQLHHVNPQGAWRQRAGPDAFRGMPNSHCGQADHVECFSSGALLKDVFFDSDTAMGVLSHVPGGMASNPLDFDAAGATRAAANALDGTERLLLHGRCMPTLPGEIDGMDAQLAQFPVAAFKTYTQFGPRDGAAGFFLDDDRFGAPLIERARKLGVRRIAVHKGLPFGQRGYEFSSARDIGPVARRHPDMTFLLYHAGFDPSVKEGPYDAQAKFGVDALVRSMQEAGNPSNVYAELGSTWRYVMRDPDQAAHLMGKLLEDVRRRPCAVGHRLHLVRQPAGPDPGLSRVPDQPRVPAAPWLPRADGAAQAQGVRPQRRAGVRPEARCDAQASSPRTACRRASSTT